MTKVISVRLDDKLHKDLKRQMVDDDTSFQEYVVNLIKKDRESRKSEN
ncbi:MAG: hypothetical protein ACRCTZ_07710 [Sarcina sp.]